MKTPLNVDSGEPVFLLVKKAVSRRLGEEVFHHFAMNCLTKITTELCTIRHKYMTFTARKLISLSLFSHIFILSSEKPKVYWVFQLCGISLHKSSAFLWL